MNIEAGMHDFPPVAKTMLTELIILVIYTVVVAVACGFGVGTWIRSPFLAALAGGPAAVCGIYGSAVAIGLVFTDPGELQRVDWWLFMALLIYPATPAFAIGLVAACITSFLRTIRPCGLS